MLRAVGEPRTSGLSGSRPVCDASRGTLLAPQAPTARWIPAHGPIMNVSLLARYDRPGPRYTSYPTALEFHTGFGPAEYAERLQSPDVREPLSVYVHLPFCAERCWFCACTAIATHRRDVMDRYLETLFAELDLVLSHTAARRVGQLHFGGGTPTWYSPEALERLVRRLEDRLDFSGCTERSVEADPRITTREHLDVLARLGFNRISFGVQDIDPDVQRAIGREQSWDETADLLRYARERGFASVNVDLVFGLPGQQVERFEAGVREVLNAQPDRVAIYGFAFVPWSRGHQKKLATDALPDTATRGALLDAARDVARELGYVDIGLDHFALPDDDLATAQRAGTLHRNFMGYTTAPGGDTLGLGVSAIGAVAGAWVQSHRRLIDWQRAIEAGTLPVERGVALTDDDVQRGWVIAELMCNFVVPFGEFEARFGARFQDLYTQELTELGPFEADGLVAIHDDRLEVHGIGKRLVRNVAMVFDAYTRRRSAEATSRFSRTV